MTAPAAPERATDVPPVGVIADPGNDAVSSTEGLARATVAVSVATTLSRVFGLARDIVIANIFGAGIAADAFFVAFRIPNFFRRLFAEGAFAAGFVPVLTRFRQRATPADVVDLVAHVSGSLTLVLALVSLVGVAMADWLTLAFAPGFAADVERRQLTTELLRLMFPYLLLISLAALAGSTLNAHGRFFAPAAVPLLLNVTLIGAALLFAEHVSPPVLALGYGVLVAGVLQLLSLLRPLSQLRLLAWPRWVRGHAGTREVWRLVLPAAFAASAGQVALFIDTWLASFLTAGSVSWLYYADRLLELPVGLVGIGLATVILPTLSRQFAIGGSGDGAPSATIDWSLRVSMFVCLPAAVGLYVLAVPIMTTIFGHGAFTDVDARMAGLALQAFAVGLPAFVAVKLLAVAAFARQDMRTPMRAALIALGVNIVLNLLLMGVLGHAGLALATAAAAIVNALLLLRALLHAGAYRPSSRLPLELLRMLVAAITMGALLLAGERWLGGDVGGYSLLQPVARVVRLAAFCGAGVGIYIAVCWLLGLRPAQMGRSLYSPPFAQRADD